MSPCLVDCSSRLPRRFPLMTATPRITARVGPLARATTADSTGHEKPQASSRRQPGGLGGTSGAQGRPGVQVGRLPSGQYLLDVAKALNANGDWYAAHSRNLRRTDYTRWCVCGAYLRAPLIRYCVGLTFSPDTIQS